MNKIEIDIWRTLLYSFWIYLIIGFLFGGAILYSIGFIKSELGIKAICFWGVISLILMNEFTKCLTQLTFFKYKKEKQK